MNSLLDSGAVTVTSIPQNRSRRTKKPKPILVKQGNFGARIYTITNTVNGKRYQQFTLAYSDGRRRVLKRFANLEAAKTEADLVVTKMANGEADVLKLTSLDRAAYVQAAELLRPINVGLYDAVRDYSAAVTRLPASVGLKEVVDFYLKRHPTGPTKSVAETVQEILNSKREAKRSDVYLEDLESRLGRFASAFECSLHHVTGPAVEQYLRSLGLSGRSQNNHLRVIKGLFRHAVKRGYLPKDWNELETIELVKEDEGDIEVFTPSELQTIFNAARPEIVPWLAIAAFSGLRHAELQRLDWSEVNLAERFIEVKAGKAKTASRRTVPITDNLAAWLLPHRKEHGPVTAFDNMSKQLDWLVGDINAPRKSDEPHGAFQWKHNGLRHSFISYRLADVKSVDQVALEAGNSAQMIFRHYRQIVTESQAKAWFAISPEPAENVVTLPRAATP